MTSNLRQTAHRHLILTHEQADFDAIASLLAARILDPSAQAVLPRRLNRNVRAFLTLYGAGLPLLEHHDLQRRPVGCITLVDTQTPPSVKGQSDETRFVVIDHHPPGDVLPSDWVTHIEEVGATATLFTEALMEAGLELSPIAATLLFMGIYEDTGSLSYNNTTPRDVRASAWLLEQDASLSIASDFLNHPLSAEQRELYNHLLEAAVTQDIHGLSVVVACGKAMGMIDEISTIAHKLRDIFDPDGLFVMVALNDHIQMVARSTTDLIDVGKVADVFGGGGHTRAAAALIRGRSMDDLCVDLQAVLDRLVEPVLTVGQIMSRGPQLLDEDESIAAAFELMQRFGHEGYPVVRDNHIIGLLTRRAVDRAMNHHMEKRPVSSIMEAGELRVRPEDSIQTLQRLMIQHGWGQIPVEDPESGHIIGIVTRTDLIKAMGEDVSEQPQRAMVEQLERALPPIRLNLLRVISREAERRGDALYIVGGFVRDLLLETPSLDFDLVVEGDAIGLARALGDRFGGRISSHRRFGTAKWQLDREAVPLVEELGEENLQALPASLDFVSARTEFYTHPTALPSVKRGSIKLDLHRRDFTLNTLALRLDGPYFGQLLDHWGGVRDLEEKNIRVLHSLSFVDDPTRMLRAVRLEQRLGFEIEARTLELLEQALPLMDRVSGKRIRHELEQVFVEANAAGIMQRLAELGLLRSIHKALTWDDWLERRFVAIAGFEANPAWQLKKPPTCDFLRFAALIFRMEDDSPRAICKRLRFPGVMERAILAVNQTGRLLQREVQAISPSEVVRLLQSCREETLAGLWMCLGDEPGLQQVVHQYLALWRRVTPSVDGHDLRELGLEPGPAYRKVLWSLRAGWLDGDIKNTKQEAAYLQRLIDEFRDEA